MEVQLSLLATIAVLAGLCVAPLRRLHPWVQIVGRPRLRAILAVVSLALLAAPAEASIDLVEERSSDANPTGSGDQYSAYLHSHHDDARYEVAAANPLAVVGLIAKTPSLGSDLLRSIERSASVGWTQLHQLVRDGGVRFAILPHPCSSTSLHADNRVDRASRRRGTTRPLPLCGAH